MERATELTPRQKVMAYVANRCDDLDQQAITALTGVSNSARVAEAIIAVEYAVLHTMEIYKLAQAAKKATCGDDA